MSIKTKKRNKRRLGANQRRRSIEVRGERLRVARVHGLRITVMVLVVAALAAGTLPAVRLARRVREKMVNSRFVVVNEIAVRGNSRVTRADILALADVQKGTSLLQLSPSHIAGALKANPWIEQASVRRVLGGTLRIVVGERTPEALVSCGAVYLMDRHGVLLEPRLNADYDLVLVSGLRDTVDAQGIRRLHPSDLERYRTLRDNARPGSREWARHLGQIHFEEQGIVRLTLRGYPVSVVMSTHDAHRRMEQLWHLAATETVQSFAGITHINLSYQNLAYVY